MMFAVQIFRAGLELRIPVAKPENKGEIVPENRLVPKDTRFHQGLGALMTHYAGHPQRLAIFNRVWAFYFLITGVGRERLKQWQKPGMLHSAVLEAVAVAPVGRYGDFDADDFFATVERVSTEKYSDALRGDVPTPS